MEEDGVRKIEKRQPLCASSTPNPRESASLGKVEQHGTYVNEFPELVEGHEVIFEYE